MSKKRFKVWCDSNTEWIMQDTLLLPIKEKDQDKRLSIKQTCDLLNDLSNENDVLKQQAENRYIYVLEAYAYSDFEKHILAHQAYMSDKMFFNFVKKAQKLCETTNYIPDKPYKDYAANMIACLCKVFGFEELDYPSVHIGVSPKSKCFMWTENGAYEK